MRGIRRFAVVVACAVWTGCGDHGKHGHELDDGAVDGAVDGSIYGAVDAAGLDAGAHDADSLDGALSTGEAGAVGEAGALADAGFSFAVSDAGQVLCGSAPCACSDGLDNDHDGLVDLADPECVSSWDNDESSLATGIPGDNRDDACQDCFFDGNSGSGNDGCRIPSSCLTTGTPSSGQGSCNSCEATPHCKNYCQAYTPNGCDCFGCCTVHLGSGITKNVLLGSGCSIDGTTTSGCTECIPSTTCNNPCGECELCPGKTLADLPASCATSTSGGDAGTGAADAGTIEADAGNSGAGDAGASEDAAVPVITPTCDMGEARCGDGLPACPALSLCEFGCCILAPLL